MTGASIGEIANEQVSSHHRLHPQGPLSLGLEAFNEPQGRSALGAARRLACIFPLAI